MVDGLPSDRHARVPLAAVSYSSHQMEDRQRSSMLLVIPIHGTTRSSGPKTAGQYMWPIPTKKVLPCMPSMSGLVQHVRSLNIIPSFSLAHPGTTALSQACRGTEREFL